MAAPLHVARAGAVADAVPDGPLCRACGGGQIEEPVAGWPGWFEIDKGGLVYYYNKVTQETAWSLPNPPAQQQPPQQPLPPPMAVARS